MLRSMKEGSELIFSSFSGYEDRQWQGLADHMAAREGVHVALVRFNERLIVMILLRGAQHRWPDMREYFNTRIKSLKLDSYNLLLHAAI